MIENTYSKCYIFNAIALRGYGVCLIVEFDYRR
jgi:hypothetical protein